MTRTFVLGDPSDEIPRVPPSLRRRRSTSLSRGMIRAGVNGRDVHFALFSDFFHEQGHQQRSYKEPRDAVIHSGLYNHRLGHGVGLEVHERPSLGMVVATSSSRAT